MRVSEAFRGARSGRLTLVREVERNKFGKRQWECICDCGNMKIATINHLGYDTFSCGCLLIKHGDGKYDSEYHRLYQCYADILQRINNKNHKFYKDYGGRGIMCEFTDYESFKSWALDNGYTHELTIDRVDVDGNYSPSNCRWATPKVQGNNRRNTIKVKTPQGYKTFSELSELSGIPSGILANRYNSGDSLEDMLRPYEKGKHNNENLKNKKRNR